MLSGKDTIQNPSFITPWTIMHILEAITMYGWHTLVYPGVSLYHRLMIWLIHHTLYEIKDILVSYVHGRTPPVYMIIIPLFQAILSYLYAKSYYTDTTLYDKIILNCMIYIPVVIIYRKYTTSEEKKVLWSNNSIFNSIGDTIFAVLGFYIGYLVMKSGTMVLTILLTIFYLWLYVKIIDRD